MRGEESVSASETPNTPGSPPRARGRALHVITSFSNFRITPACAGKSYVVHLALLGLRDHPRVRGEETSFEALPEIVVGSPPRARGRDRRGAYSLQASGSPPRARGRGPGVNKMAIQARITPACAGKSLRKNTAKCSRQDHPRVRGEEIHTGDAYRCQTGSPPRARGRACMALVA